MTWQSRTWHGLKLAMLCAAPSAPPGSPAQGDCVRLLGGLAAERRIEHAA